MSHRRNFAHWRAASLALVYVLMAVHITHWLVAGKTLAPLELNEVMYTFELGIITAGFLFMAAVTLATAFVGRFFCGWGCHILAIEDLCNWLLGKLRIRPKPIRSRAFVWVPVIAALYMFVWPQVVRILEGRPLPRLHFRTDEEGWASLSTQNFWRNLPSPEITALTFAICGFLIVYVLGSRGFCAYGCPYGAVFRLADRIAPGRIRFTGRDCMECGACTAVCKSHVRVHEELNRFGMVVNPACLKDLDCVAACPKGNVSFGLGRPALFAVTQRDTPIRKAYDFHWWEEGLMAVVFVAVLVIFRGLYERIPFLMSLGMGTIAGFLLIQAVRLIRRTDLQWNRLRLKSGGRLTGAGMAYVSVVIVFVGFSVHSALVHYHSFQGRRLGNQALALQDDETLAASAMHHLELARQWGLVDAPSDLAMLADLNYHLAGDRFRAGQIPQAEHFLRAALAAEPGHVMAHYDLGALLIERGDFGTGLFHLQWVVDARPEFADGHYNLAWACWMSGRERQARSEIEIAYRLKPSDEQIRQGYGIMTGNRAP